MGMLPDLPPPPEGNEESNAILDAADAMLIKIPLRTIAKMARLHGYAVVPEDIGDKAIDVGIEVGRGLGTFDWRDAVKTSYEAIVDFARVKIL